MTTTAFKIRENQTNSRIYNILDYIDQGLTATQSIAQAFSDGGNGTYLRIPEGSYSIASQINLSTEYVTIQGSGRNSTVLTSDLSIAGSAMFNFGSTSGPIKDTLVIKDLTIDLNSKAGMWGIIASWYKNIFIENVNFINPSTTLLSALFVGKFSGASSSWESANILIKNCLFDYTGVTNSWEALTLGYARHVKVVDCIFLEKRGGFPAVTNYGSEEVVFEHNTFVNSTAIFIDGRGSTVISGGNVFQDSYVKILAADNVIIDGNAFTTLINQQANNIFGGIQIVGNQFESGDSEIPFYVTVPYTWTCKNIKITNNQFKGSNGNHIKAIPFSRAGTTYLSVDNLLIMGNNFEQSYVEGIAVWGNDVQVLGNYFTNNNTSNIGAASTHILGAAKKFTILGNHFTDTAGTITDDIRINRVTYTTQIPAQQVNLLGNSFDTSTIKYYDGNSYVSSPDGGTTTTSTGNITN